MSVRQNMRLVFVELGFKEHRGLVLAGERQLGKGYAIRIDKEDRFSVREPVLWEWWFVGFGQQPLAPPPPSSFR